jgi:hypothetical protein
MSYFDLMPDDLIHIIYDYIDDYDTYNNMQHICIKLGIIYLKHSMKILKIKISPYIFEVSDTDNRNIFYLYISQIIIPSKHAFEYILKGGAYRYSIEINCNNKLNNYYMIYTELENKCYLYLYNFENEKILYRYEYKDLMDITNIFKEEYQILKKYKLVSQNFDLFFNRLIMMNTTILITK